MDIIVFQDVHCGTYIFGSFSFKKKKKKKEMK